MGRLKNIPQGKEKEILPEQKLSEVEASNLPDIEFNSMVIKMLKEFRGRTNEISENLKR